MEKFIKNEQWTRIIKEIAKNEFLDQKIIKILLSVDRKFFIPKYFSHLAYTRSGIPIKKSRWLSSPNSVAKILKYIELNTNHSLLVVGCGTGYQSVLASKLCKKVQAIDTDSELIYKAKEIIKLLDINNIDFKCLDEKSIKSLDEQYDRIFVLSTMDISSTNLLDSLSNNGILLAPIIEEKKQIMTRYSKNDNFISQEALYYSNFN